jgi:hypothetical protein
LGNNYTVLFHWFFPSPLIVFHTCVQISTQPKTICLGHRASVSGQCYLWLKK